MTYSTNLPTVLQTVNLKLTDMQREKMTRLQATSLLAVMRDRIHVQGKDSNGSQIGTYTPAYIRVRNSKKYRRGTDSKVIISLTRQLEDGCHVEALTTGEIGYAITLRTQEDMQKARWCEQTYKKPIFAPTAEERAMVMQIADDFIAKHLHG